MKLITKLQTTFGHNSFRGRQLDVITNVLPPKSSDTFVLFPTGMGKSLCYQLPATMLPGLTIVVSPLIALIQDQVQQLQGLGIPAADAKHNLHQVISCVKLLYVYFSRTLSHFHIQNTCALKNVYHLMQSACFSWLLSTSTEYGFRRCIWIEQIFFFCSIPLMDMWCISKHIPKR